MLVPWCDLNRRHLSTVQCAREAEPKRRRREEEELWESSERDFQAYGKPLENLTAFKYLGRVMTAGGGRLAGSGRQPTKCEEELGEVVEYFEPGGGGPESIGSLFQGGSIGDVDFRGRYIGPDPPDLAGLVKLSA